MSKWSQGQKMCATCQYWEGKRDTDYNRLFVETFQDKSHCQRLKYAPDAPCLQTSTCQRYERWSKLNT